MDRKRNYIGLAATPHDPALAIVNSQGEIVFAEATERFLQNKKSWGGNPEDVIRIKTLLQHYCDKDADIVIATSWRNTTNYLFRMMWLNPVTKFLTQKILNSRYFKQELKHYALFFRMTMVTAPNLHLGENIVCQMSALNPDARVLKKTYDHHLTHAAAACYSSPFIEGVCAIMDGMGEKVATSFYQYKDGKITKLPGDTAVSLGIFYSAICDLCGFSFMKGEEWKVMGLAAYGKYDRNIYRIFQSLLSVKKGKLRFGKNLVSNFNKLRDLRVKPNDNPLNAADLAYTAQLFFSNVTIEILKSLHAEKISDNLIIGGGCGLNSSCNGILLQNTSFENLHVFSAPADDGNAVGAALLAYYEDHPNKKAPAKHQTPYLGEQMSLKVLNNLKTYGNLKTVNCSAQEVALITAQLLAQGKIVGWVQGRAEFGPRALGNRSILADPRSAEIKDRLNATVKFREEFRPFAPSILHEYGPEYFEHYQESPYMERTLRFKENVKDKVPGVVHVDGTGRLQTVKKEWNEKYHALISAFHQLTGIPVLLNTSFNVMGKPIIHSVEDAVAVFLTSGLDVLVIEDQIFTKI